MFIVVGLYDFVFFEIIMINLCISILFIVTIIKGG
jgi:hypothetical protein